MNGIDILIVDDERSARENVSRIIKHHFQEISIQGIASSGKEALEMLAQTPVHALLIDVQMPNMDGFKLLSEARKLRPGLEAIFVTAHGHYAIDALRSRALDYILKPIKINELAEALERLKQALNGPEDPEPDAELRIQRNRVALSDMGGVLLVDLADIVNIAAHGAYSRVFIMSSKRTLTVAKTLKQFEDALGRSFFRIHKSHLVNLDHLIKYESQDDAILMRNGQRIPIATRRLAEFRQEVHQRFIQIG